MKSQTQILARKVLRHMEAVSSGNQVGGILLMGDPGIGKTTFIDILGSLLGMKVVTIEVPHITEEHLINIPFIVFNPITNQTKNMSSSVSTGEDYELVLAKSNLYVQITTTTPMNDEQYLRHIQKAPKYVQELYKALGGTATEIPKEIQDVRENHKVVLFLDEYYRHVSTRIRNILRGILNKKIGIHTIPNSVYVIYASNMRDTGIEEIHSNAQFKGIEFKAPSKKDWFSWLEFKFEEHESVELNKKLMDKFKKILKDEDINFHDVEKDVYTSPRRWEQLLLYINSSFPVKDYDEARALITNVKNKFVNYRTGEHSKLHEKVLDAVIELIKDTSRINIKPTETLEESDWRSALDHLVTQQMKLGSNVGKFVPIISGAPGIGKTKEAWRVAEKHNLRLIDIDVSELNSEDVIGMPIPGKRTNESVVLEQQPGMSSINVKFSLPKLAQQIEKECKEKDAEYIAGLKEKYGKEAESHIRAYENQKYKYLIFFDELNRTDEKTFNSLRRVILEKNFGPKGDGSGELLKLPKGSIVIGAMNPEGAGTAELTRHFADVIDVIPADANWNKVKDYLMKEIPFRGVSEATKSVAMNILEEFIRKFRTHDTKKYTLQNAPFHLETAGAELYVSPREYQDAFATLVRELNAGIKDILEEKNKVEDIRSEIDEIVADALEDSFNFIFYKHQVDKEEFMHLLRQWVKNLDDIIFQGVISKKVLGVTDLSVALASYLDGKNLLDMPEDMAIVNANNTINHEEFINEIKDLLVDKIKNENALNKYIADETHDKIEYNKAKEKLTIDSKKKVSLFENFVLALLYTLSIHGYSNDRLEKVGKSISVSASDITNKLFKSSLVKDKALKNKVTMTILRIRSDVHSLVLKL